MLKIDISQTRPISELPRNYFQLLKEAEDKGAVIFLRRNRPVSVLVSFDNWQELEKLRRKSEEEDAIKRISRSEIEFKKGKGKLLKSLKDLR